MVATMKTLCLPAPELEVIECSGQEELKTCRGAFRRRIVLSALDGPVKGLPLFGRFGHSRLAKPKPRVIWIFEWPLVVPPYGWKSSIVDSVWKHLGPSGTISKPDVVILVPTYEFVRNEAGELGLEIQRTDK